MTLAYCAPMAKPYIHGFSRDEQSRLVEQAQVLAPNVFRDIDFSRVRDALEIGCGVGAELKIMCERWPRLRWTGLDWSQSHLAAATGILGRELATGRIGIVRADARSMPFQEKSFDLAVTIWMLEHVNEPERILREALRILKPGGFLVCTEVDNSTFGFDPKNAVIEAWWMRFNEYQTAAGGDPFVGGKLQGLAEQMPCRNILTRVLPIISSRREPRRRQVLLDYLQDLLLSGSENMIRNGIVDEVQKKRLVAEFQRVHQDANIQFQYQAVRLVCQAPADV